MTQFARKTIKLPRVLTSHSQESRHVGTTDINLLYLHCRGFQPGERKGIQIPKFFGLQSNIFNETILCMSLSPASRKNHLMAPDIISACPDMSGRQIFDTYISIAPGFNPGEKHPNKKIFGLQSNIFNEIVH